MNANLINFVAHFNDRGSMEIRLQTSNMIEENDGYYSKYPTSIYINNNELPLFLSCLKGESKIYPWFDDISYLVRPYSDGMKIMHISDTKCQTWYVNFPFKMYNNLLNAIEGEIDNPCEFTLTLTPYERQYFTDMTMPLVKWNYQDRMSGKWENFEYKEWIEKSITESVNNQKSQYPELTNNLESLQRIATNYSVFGELVEIDLSFDCYNNNPDIPDSYYFNIHMGNNRIMNGGIIAHEEWNNKERTGNYHFSMHT